MDEADAEVWEEEEFEQRGEQRRKDGDNTLFTPRGSVVRSVVRRVGRLREGYSLLVFSRNYISKLEVSLRPY